MSNQNKHEMLQVATEVTWKQIMKPSDVKEIIACESDEGSIEGVAVIGRRNEYDTPNFHKEIEQVFVPVISTDGIVWSAMYYRSLDGKGPIAKTVLPIGGVPINVFPPEEYEQQVDRARQEIIQRNTSR